jgi:hypothetical protein
VPHLASMGVPLQSRQPAHGLRSRYSATAPSLAGGAANALVSASGHAWGDLTQNLRHLGDIFPARVAAGLHGHPRARDVNRGGANDAPVTPWSPEMPACGSTGLSSRKSATQCADMLTAVQGYTRSRRARVLCDGCLQALRLCATVAHTDYQRSDTPIVRFLMYA